jgi:hypothetical protein
MDILVCVGAVGVLFHDNKEIEVMVYLYVIGQQIC